jgi:glycosyltransferase involved in cell wall biosynthesis
MRVLIVAYAYPPCGASAAYPTIQLVKYLLRQGHDARVLTVREGYHHCLTTEDACTWVNGAPARRTAMWSPLPWWEGLTARRAGGGERADLAVSGDGSLRKPARVGWRGRLAELVSIPDSTVGWVCPAVMRARAMLARERYDVVYTVSPVHSAHLVGLALRLAAGPPWAADFHDPWSASPWRSHHTRLARVVDRRLERLVVDRADLLVGRTEGIMRGLLAARSRNGRPRHTLVVPCGFDPEEIAAAAPLAERLRRPGRFVVTHTGAFYGRRNPLSMLRALAAAARSGRLPEGLLLRLVGRWEEGLRSAARPWLERLRESGSLEVIEQVNHLQSIVYALASDALLLIQMEAPDQVPAKAYEYLGVGRPLVALTDAGATADLTLAAGGAVVSVGDEGALAEMLRELQAAIRAGRSPGPPASLAEQFAAPNIVARIAGELQAISAARAGRGADR